MKREKFMFRFMLAVPQKRKRKEMLFFLINTPISSFNLFKFGMLSISWKKSYVMIHVIKHDMDPNSNINYRRKIAPKYVFHER